MGLITQNEDMPGMLTMDKGYNDMSKFLNRILGMPVLLQNLLFKYFTDTLNSIIDSVSINVLVMFANIQVFLLKNVTVWGIHKLQGVSVKSTHQEKHYQHLVIYTTWSCNMSYEWKFCGLSEYVQFTKVKPLIKSTNWPKWDLADFGKSANSQI